MQKQKEKYAQGYHERKNEWNKVLIFAEAPFFPSLIHVSSVILFLYMTIWFTWKKIISPLKFVE